MHLEISGQYEKKIEKLYSKKNQRHIDLKLQDKVSLKNNIFQICMNNKYIVSIDDKLHKSNSGENYAAYHQ